MTTVEFRGPTSSYQQQQQPHPHRTPVHAAGNASRNDLRPLRQSIVPDHDFSASKQQPQNPSSFSMYTRKGPQPPLSSSPGSQQYPNHIATSRRTPSQSTTSTGYTPSRTPSNVSSQLSRNASTRSGASITPGSYVALMRKQKATVWCDRSQHEDPRIAAQHKAAKIRAAREITGKTAEGRTSTSGSMGSGSLGVRSKIRHHGLPKATGYSSANMVGGGVPLRLSANEVGDDGYTYDDTDSARRMSHQRTGSAKSSDRWLGVDQRYTKRYSQNSSPGQESSPNEDIPELQETPVPGSHQQHGGGYFPSNERNNSGSSGDLENNFGNVAQMEAPKVEEKKRRTSEELRRRGSVDERANTMGYMGGGRLFVANPDLSD
ncbi:hypothetical protein N7G274_006504 [Stereocaulon virgatum]|uniref:Uncharacterized protein n=1 Tax=Stereocaulon virgatum TaxID=373712 RepID=A0ABR4A513_9LECA